ncbi:hypothetical protein JCGZ_20053 [Jatropha curcas]|uniref:RNase H type-1 domain-containing protein n=1 Tax=Jatropha curcas TaxID=180498 RepID=A0A067LAW9_JATCU|nr:hypothetical protein JCGZ_20053 [Jatropha curcas]
MNFHTIFFFLNLLRSIKLLLSRDWQVKFLHCFREANKVADSLANMAVMAPSSRMVFVDPPLLVLDHLRWDRYGTSWPRLISG